MTTALATPEPKLLRYDAMVQAIERAVSVDEAKEYRAQAIAMAAYAKQALNLENERKCVQIRIRAERRAGELLRETAKNGQRAKAGDKESGRGKRLLSRPTLGDHGISRDQSSDWQKLATIPQKKFEEELDKPGVPSTHQILVNVYPKEPEPSLIRNVDRAAVQIWGVLCDFERDKLLQREPRKLLATMTEPMREDVLRLAPAVISWLKGFEEE